MVTSFFPVTGHMLIKNEDRFVWYALAATAPFLAKMIIYDTGSCDKTVEIIKYFIKEHPELDINLSQKKKCRATDLSQFRQEQLKRTETPWFLLIDGDEVWPKQQLLKLLKRTSTLPESKLAVVNRTKNCTGDVWHYLPESFGKYHLLGKTGHFNIRLLRTKPYTVAGKYPDEGYFLNGQNIATQTKLLTFSSAWYLHASHLVRSTRSSAATLGRRQEIIARGLKMEAKDLPRVFFESPESTVPDVLGSRDAWFELRAWAYDILRNLR